MLRFCSMSEAVSEHHSESDVPRCSPKKASNMEIRHILLREQRQTKADAKGEGAGIIRIALTLTHWPKKSQRGQRRSKIGSIRRRRTKGQVNKQGIFRT